MRELFIVGAKLLGIYFLFDALILIVSSTGLIATITRSRESIMGPSSADIFLVSCFTLITSLGFAYLLLFQTDWLADRFKLAGLSQATPGGPEGGRLQIGIILIGIYVFSTRIGSLVHAILTNLAENNMRGSFAATQPNGLTFSLNFIPSVVTLLFSLFLIFGSGKIATLLGEKALPCAENKEHRIEL